MIAANSIRKAIYNRLIEHGATKNYTIRYNHANAYPYIKIGNVQVYNRGNKSDDGVTAYPEINILTDPEDYDSDPCDTIAENVERAIRMANVTLTGDGFASLGPPFLDLAMMRDDYNNDLGKEVKNFIIHYRYMITDANDQDFLAADGYNVGGNVAEIIADGYSPNVTIEVDGY